jgi:pimeloyl-ACP methyl ester carboxylesterase
VAGAAAVAMAVAVVVGRPRAIDRPAVERLTGPDPHLTPAAVPGDPPESRPGRFLTTVARPSLDDASGAAPAPRATVVLVHGFGCTSMEWADAVGPLLAEQPGLVVFSYDRIVFAEPGDAPAASRRTGDRLAAELRALLEARGLQPPFVLVGHSYGGLIAQIFALAYPEAVDGLVLVDPAHEDQNRKFPGDFAFSFKAIPPLFSAYAALSWTGVMGLLDRLGAFNFPPTFLFKRPELRRATVRLYSDAAVWRRCTAELVGCNTTFAHIMAELRAKHLPLSPDRTGPLALLIAADRRYSPTRHPKAVTQAFLDIHAPLVEAHGVQPIMAEQSDHWIHLQQPQLVVDAVLDVLVRRQREGGAGGEKQW